MSAYLIDEARAYFIVELYHFWGQKSYKKTGAQGVVPLVCLFILRPVRLNLVPKEGLEPS